MAKVGEGRLDKSSVTSRGKWIRAQADSVQARRANLAAKKAEREEKEKQAKAEEKAKKRKKIRRSCREEA